MKNKMLKFVFIGTPEFGATVLKEMLDLIFRPTLVITAPDKPVGRKQMITFSPVKEIADKYGLPISQPKDQKNLINEIKKADPDFVVVAASSTILPKEALDIPKHGCINIHPSLLPKYRGPSPIQAAILNGDRQTGVSLMLMDEKIDHGPIIAMSKRLLGEKTTYTELSRTLGKIGAKLLVLTIPRWIEGEIEARPQNHKEAIYTKLIKKEDGRIDWKKPVAEIERQLRAYEVWPGCYTLYKNKRLKILEGRFFKSPTGKTYPVGKPLIVPPNDLAVQCGDGNFLAINRLKLEGKNEMQAEDFARGFPDFLATILK